MSRTAATVLRSVLEHGPVARSTIAHLTGLSAATVTKQYAELAERGLVRVIVEHSQLGWTNVLAKAFLTNALDTGVRVESHSRALARAEQLFGNDIRARTSVVHLFVGRHYRGVVPSGCRGRVQHHARGPAVRSGAVRRGGTADPAGCSAPNTPARPCAKHYGLPRPANQFTALPV